MHVFYSEECLKHYPEFEILSGSTTPYFESPLRLTTIKEHLAKNLRFTFLKPSDYGLEPILRIHTKGYIEYMQTAYQNWCCDDGEPTGVIGECFPHPKLIANSLDHWKEFGNSATLSRAGLYSFDLSSVITADTWHSAYISAQTTLSAARDLLSTMADGTNKGPKACLALCRPPGHHAGDDLCGGYCFLNNTAIACQFLKDYKTLDDTVQNENEIKLVPKVDQSNAQRILILDIDYHHGNGTQAIFYEQANPLYISLHGVPDYPWFTGSEREQGKGEGAGYNINVPLHKQTTTDETYLKALRSVLQCEATIAFNADIIIVSLGVDTWHKDPIAGFPGLVKLRTYYEIGQTIQTAPATINRPCLFVTEGGYYISDLGEMVENVLEGFLS